MGLDVSSVFLVVEPSKIIFLISNTVPLNRGYDLTLYWVPWYPQIRYYSCEFPVGKA